MADRRVRATGHLATPVAACSAKVAAAIKTVRDTSRLRSNPHATAGSRRRVRSPDSTRHYARHRRKRELGGMAARSSPPPTAPALSPSALQPASPKPRWNSSPTRPSARSAAATPSWVILVLAPQPQPPLVHTDRLRQPSPRRPLLPTPESRTGGRIAIRQGERRFPGAAGGGFRRAKGPEGRCCGQQGLSAAPRSPGRSASGLVGGGAPGRIRTCDPRIRSPPLYPAELRAPRAPSSHRGRDRAQRSKPRVRRRGQPRRASSGSLAAGPAPEWALRGGADARHRCPAPAQHPDAQQPDGDQRGQRDLRSLRKRKASSPAPSTWPRSRAR